MMVIVGTWLFGSYAGRAVVHARSRPSRSSSRSIGTTLSCISTGARVTYAMGRDDEVPSHFGMLHGKNADAAPGDLDAGGHLGGHRHRRRVVLYLCGTAAGSAAATPRTTTSGISFGVFAPDDVREAAQQAAHRHAGQQLRHVPALHADLHHRHRGLPRAPHVQRLQAHVRSGLRPAGQPGLHAVLPDRSVHGHRHEQDGAVHRPRRRGSGASTARSTSCAPARRSRSRSSPRSR